MHWYGAPASRTVWDIRRFLGVKTQR
jgi:hypothetical protein